jgi:hypothetical protein
MAGYSGTPLAKKLGLKPGALLLIINEPQEMERWLAPLPEGVRRAGRRTTPESVDVIVCFTQSTDELGKRLAGLMAALKRDGGLWIAWPKLAARKISPRWETDLTEDAIRARALAAGLVDNKVCAISDVWSGLRLVYRRKDR